MTLVTQLVVGALTAVCTSLVVVLLLWRLSRHFSLRATPPPCCDVTDLLAWLLDACQAVMGAAILVLVVSDDVTCSVAGFLAMFGGVQTLCLLATRAVVMATGHVDRDRSREMGRCDMSSKADDKQCAGGCGWSIAMIITQFSLVTVFCALPLSQLPVATAMQRNHTTRHLTCLPLTLQSRDTAAWRYSCFLLVAFGWLPLLVAMVTDVIHCWCHRYRAERLSERSCGSCGFLLGSALRQVCWALVIVLVSVEALTVPSVSRRDAVQLVLVLAVDAAMLIHVLHHILCARHTLRNHHHHHHHQQQQQQQQQQQLPARLSAVSRAQQQLVCLLHSSNRGVQINY